MKTTLDLNDSLVARAKAAAVKEATTLTKMVEEGLALRLRRKHALPVKSLKELPVSSKSGGLCDGIDGKSNRSMLDAVDV